MSLFKILSAITGQKIILPFYHAVTNNTPKHLKHLYKVRSVKMFEQDLDFLLQHYTPISIDDIFNHLQGVKQLPKQSFFISFDDGLAEFKEFSWPVLKRKSIPTSLFVNPNFIDNKELFFRFKASILIDFIENNRGSKKVKEVQEHLTLPTYKLLNVEDYIMNIGYGEKELLDDLAISFNIDFSDYLETQKPYLSLSDLHELNKQGVHIGAHSMTHPLFNKLDRVGQVSQLTESVSWVSKNFNQQIKSFSFPFTDYDIDADFFRTIYNNNKPLADLTFGTAGLKNERFKHHMQRIPIENNEDSMRNILLKQHLYYMVKMPLFKNTVKR